MTKRRKIKSATITTIALCQRGMNGLPVIYKAGDSATPNQKDDDMTPEQLAALAKAITDGVVAALPKPAPVIEKSQAEKDAEAALVKAKALPVKPVFEGDPTNKEARTAFLNKMRAYEIAVAVAGGKSADEVEELFKKLDEVEPSDVEAGIAKEDKPEVRDLKRKLFKAQRRSNQAAPGTETPAGEDTLSKEMDESIALGDSIAAIVNKSRGYAVPTKA